MLSPNSMLDQKLREYIQVNGFKPGNRLPIHSELCKILNVGSRPLREALGVLGRQGIIETHRRGGTVLATPSVKELNEPIAWQLERRGYSFDDLVKARAMMESEVAAEAAKVRNAQDLLVILSAIEKMEVISSSGSDAENADEAFHLAILQATHNPVMLVFGQLIDAQFKRKIPGTFYKSAKRMQESIKEHKLIYSYIEKRKPEAARKFMYNHIMYMSEKKARVTESR